MATKMFHMATRDLGTKEAKQSPITTATNDWTKKINNPTNQDGKETEVPSRESGVERKR